MRKSVRVKGVVLAVLFLIAVIVWYAALREDRGGKLTVSFLNVGEGDAVLIDAPSGRQALVDGGPDGSVLRALGSVMPPWDRSLDVIVAASADAGESGGLPDVLQRYSTGMIVQSGTQNASASWNLFEKEAATRGASIRTARRGQIIDLGKGAYIQILFPDRSLPNSPTGESCVVSRLVYGHTAFLFSCKAEVGVQNYLAMLDGQQLHSDVLLAATTTPAFLGYVAPQYTIAPCTKTALCQGATFVSDEKTVERH